MSSYCSIKVVSFSEICSFSSKILAARSGLSYSPSKKLSVFKDKTLSLLSIFPKKHVNSYDSYVGIFVLFGI